MTKPISYKVLSKSKFSLNGFNIIPLRMRDRFLIMKWRNEQLYHLRQKKKLNEKDQENYFNEVVNGLFEKDYPIQILFSFIHTKKCVGYGGLVHIDWENKNAEISFVMDTSLEKIHFKNYWGVFLKLIEKVAFEEIKLNKIYIYSYNLRPQLYEVTDNNFYILEAKLKEHIFYDGNYVDVNIHSKLISSYEKSANSN